MKSLVGFEKELLVVEIFLHKLHRSPDPVERLGGGIPGSKSSDDRLDVLTDLDDGLERGVVNLQQEAEGPRQVPGIRFPHDRTSTRTRLHGDDTVHLEKP